MKTPTPDEQISIIAVAKQHPRFVEFLQSWRFSELERLPSQQQNVALFQGRCQVLRELCDRIEGVLKPAAPRPTTKQIMHTDRSI